MDKSSNSSVNDDKLLFNIMIFSGILLTFSFGLLNLLFDNINYATYIFIIIAIVLISEHFYSVKSGKYKHLIYITIILIYMILYPVLFFITGGSSGYIPCIFVYAIASTFIILRKKRLIFLVLLEIIVYFIMYIIEFTHPHLFYSSNINRTISVIAPVITGLIFGMTIYIYVHSYRLRNQKLEYAKIQTDAANKAKDDFFSSLNQELRTPVHVMMGMNEMIIRESSSKDILEYAKNSQKAGENLQILINKLLVYSRIESGNMKPMFLEFALLELIDGFIMSCTNECRRKQLDFDFHIGTAIPDGIMGDEILLKQVLYNLLSGTINCTENGHIFFMADWENTYPNSGILKLRLETSITDISEATEGTDFGMTMIQGIVTAMKGTMDIKSSNENGSSFDIIIPFKLLKQKDSTGYSDILYQISNTQYTAKDARILVVDDSEMNIKVVSLLLKHTQIKIDSALNGTRALELISENEYHLMLIDYRMPGMNGAELIKKIRLRYPKVYESTPIFALSANTDTATRKMLIRCGFKSYLPKPIESNLLEFIIRNNIPSELIVESTPSGETANINPDIVTKYKIQLLKYDISLNDGLLYMSGDLFQYVKIAELMKKNYDKNRTKIEQLYSDSNIKDLGITIHALKGNAKFIGARPLYNIAVSIEKNAAVNETEYLHHSLPLLYYQWNKTIKGLTVFLDDFQQSGLIPDDSGCFVEIDTENYLDQLIEYTDNFQPEPALRLIQQLLKQDIPFEKIKQLNMAAEYLEDLEYDDAMNIFKEMI